MNENTIPILFNDPVNARLIWQFMMCIRRNLVDVFGAFIDFCFDWCCIAWLHCVHLFLLTFRHSGNTLNCNTYICIYSFLLLLFLEKMYHFTFWHFVFVASIKCMWTLSLFFGFWFNKNMRYWKSKIATEKMNWNWLRIIRFCIRSLQNIIELTNQCSFVIYFHGFL